jgi:hypothetical protein
MKQPVAQLPALHTLAAPQLVPFESGVKLVVLTEG